MYRYLVENLTKLKEPVIWLHNPRLDANMRSLYIEGYHIVIIKNMPICENDYFDIAHEIGHLLLGELGYPRSNIVDGDKNKTYLGTSLTNTILDPKINKEVIKYGFDFIAYINKSIDIQIPIIQRYPEENMLHKYDKHFLKCLLIEKILEWDIFEDGINNPFEDLYKIKYPSIYKQTVREISFIREVGVDTPEKAKVILERILKNNEMDDVIKVI